MFRIERKPDVTKEDSVRMTSERILVVYDGPDILEALVTVLDDSGFQTSGAPGGCSVHQTFYEIQTQLVMLDLIMPMRSGVDVCRQIRSMLDAPVVSLSGVEDVEFGKELLAPPPPAKQPQQTAPQACYADDRGK